MLQYFIIQTLLYVICTYLGYRLSKKNENKYFWMMVITFTLIEGLRFGRGTDYNLYVGIWDNIQIYNFYSNPEAIVFNFMCITLQLLGLPYQALIILCSFILAYCGFTFMRRYRECLAISIPLFILYTITAENLYRWWTGFAFILLGIHYYLNGRKLWFWIFSLVGCGVHIMLLAIVPLLYLLLKRGEKILLKPWLAVGLTFFVTMTWNVSNMLYLNNILHSVLGGMEHYQGYLNRSEDLLTGQWQGEKMEISVFSYIRVIVYSSFYIFVGYKIIKIKPHLTPYYNFVVIAAIFNPINYLEMIGRYIRLLLVFQCLLGSYCYLYVLKHYVKTNAITIILSIALIGGNCAQIIKKNFETNNWHNMYIWNADGRRYVPLIYWQD